MSIKHFFSTLPLFCLLALLPIRADEAQATLESDTDAGSVQYQVPGATAFTPLPWKTEVKIPVGTVIKTNEVGVAKLVPFSGSKVVIMPGSTATVSSLGIDKPGDKPGTRAASISLADGTLKTMLSHKGDNTTPIDFSVQTPTCVAAAKGTKYVTSYSKASNTSFVFVMQGVVGAGGMNIPAGGVAAIGAGGHGHPVSQSSVPPAIVASTQSSSGSSSSGGGSGTGNSTTVSSVNGVDGGNSTPMMGDSPPMTPPSTPVTPPPCTGVGCGVPPPPHCCRPCCHPWCPPPPPPCGGGAPFPPPDSGGGFTPPPPPPAP